MSKKTCPGIKITQDRVVIGPHGPGIEFGYTEIGGVRLYPERVVIGPYGAFVLPARQALSGSKEK